MQYLTFPGFQTLDLFGPLEMLGSLRDDINITLVAETIAPIPSVHGQSLIVDKTFADGCDYDLLFIPGGDAAIAAADSHDLKNWVIETANQAELIMTVFTGSILLAISGVLDDHKATTNKLDLTQTVPLGPNVDWIRQARCVEDGKFFTSSGVSAGIDMALAAIAHLFGNQVAVDLAEESEYEWHNDANSDPFAKLAGLL